MNKIIIHLAYRWRDFSPSISYNLKHRAPIPYIPISQVLSTTTIWYYLCFGDYVTTVVTAGFTKKRKYISFFVPRIYILQVSSSQKKAVMYFLVFIKNTFLGVMLWPPWMFWVRTVWLASWRLDGVEFQCWATGGCHQKPPNNSSAYMAKPISFTPRGTKIRSPILIEAHVGPPTRQPFFAQHQA